MSLRDAVTGLSHIGVRVHDLARSRAFYEKLGFDFQWGPFGAEHVVGMRHASGLEINLIVNAPDAAAPNVLLDVPRKHAGFTHIALAVGDVTRLEAALGEAGIAISGKRGENPVRALFVRDPDGNVIELASD
jgi:lactoylglutathione lyase